MCTNGLTHYSESLMYGYIMCQTVIVLKSSFYTYLHFLNVKSQQILFRMNQELKNTLHPILDKLGFFFI